MTSKPMNGDSPSRELHAMLVRNFLGELKVEDPAYLFLVPEKEVIDYVDGTMEEIFKILSRNTKTFVSSRRPLDQQIIMTIMFMALKHMIEAMRENIASSYAPGAPTQH